MSQEAADKFSKDLSKESVVVTDTLFVKDVPGFTGKRYDLPITHTATETCGKVLFANIVALGAIVALTIASAMMPLLKPYCTAFRKELRKPTRKL
jgi:2-oxoglutarate ferredoxin oxidoreductase subunit gamma